jgi:threonine/homoserine/homoserine lactone efflux protein
VRTKGFPGWMGQMDSSYLIKGMIIGFSIAAPVGPIGVLCINRTLNAGRRAGLLTGVGAATADAIYAFIGGFGVKFVSDILVSQQAWFRIIGGIFLCFLGIKTFLRKTTGHSVTVKEPSPAGTYGSTFVLTLTNPVTILSFAAIFAGVGPVGPTGGYLSAGLLVVAVFAGSCIWWLTLSCCVGLLRARFNARSIRWLNVISGSIMLGFGALVLIGLRS